MHVLRGLLFDNLGLKFTALLLAVLVYLNVYTDRTTTMLVSFPLELGDLPDSLSVSGPVPAVVQAELRGTGKQLILLRVKEPRLRVSLAGAHRGRYERALVASDLPLPEDGTIAMENLVGPRVVTLEIDRRIHRQVPVRAHVTGQPAAGFMWTGVALAEPSRVKVTGPEQELLDLDTLHLAPVRIDGRRDTVSALVTPVNLPEWSTADPPAVAVRVSVGRRMR
jgi:YbbR domain-containing protein